jgi:quinoprotein glucose dehydrogenase
MSRLFVVVPLFVLAVAFLAYAVPPDGVDDSKGKAQSKKTAAEQAAAQVQLADKNLKVEVWAAEPLLVNPVCFCFDEKGRCYVVETHRLHDGVPDTRGKPWLDDDLACRTVADRVAMYKKYNFPRFEQNSERVKLIWDSTGSGKADKATVFADGFNRSEDGIAAGVLARKGSIYFACIPDLYLLKDTKNANQADVKESLATGFGIHVQFIGHDLHGLRIGPDGKLYMSIGDRGLNVTTKEGRKLFYPDTGCVLRCDRDGNNLEVVHSGLRNPQELAFDDYGNLFTCDNNSDSGDQVRWVNIVEGGESGWRGGYQYGTGYHTPAVPQGNRGPWNTEKLWYPQWEGQAAYIVPPLLNFANGPSGLTHYPGIGLNDKYKDHFFCTDFTGGPGGSVIWSLSVKPKGAGFEVVGKPQPFVRNMLPTDCEFGPDGAFYWSDWTNGWNMPDKGRIFRVSDPEAMKNPAVAEARKLIAEGYEKKTVEELVKLLEFPHQQVRQEAQFELAGRKPEVAIAAFSDVLKKSKNQLARLHAVWGLGIIARKNLNAPYRLLAFIKDADSEVRQSIINQLGTAVSHYHRNINPMWGKLEFQILDAIRGSFKDSDTRVQAAAAVAYGKIGDAPSIQTPQAEQSSFAPFFDLLKTNNDKDPYLRHAVVMGIVHATFNPVDLWNVWKLAKDKYDVPAVRLGVLLALRKLESEKTAAFLTDPEPRIVAEAARAVYDTRLMSGMPALAKLADKSAQLDAIAFRALGACFLVGTAENAGRIARFAGRSGEPDYTRAFALHLLSDWANPPRRDPIMGVTLSLEKRDATVAADALKAVGVDIFSGSDIVRKEAAQVAAKLGIKEFGPAMVALAKDVKQPVSVRVEALYAVDALRDPMTKELAAFALSSDEPKLRAAGRAVKARLEPIAVLRELPELLKDTQVSIPEKQGAFAILAKFGTSPEKQGVFATLARLGASSEVDKLLDEWLNLAIMGKVPGEIVLDVLDAAEQRANTPKLKLYASLKQKVDKYRAAQNALASDPNTGDKLAPYLESLAGGDAQRGRNIFLNNSAVYCQRCHKLDGQGGEVGPQLNGIAADKEKDRRYLLESVVYPNAKIAKGYETVILVLADGRTVSGVLKSDDKKQIKLVTAENKEIVVPADEVESRRSGPSAMPDDLHKKLSRRELRDVVEFLASLKKP